ncbi:DUF3592 domain-containing protein [Micromonospora peucetia]|uniref:DUF3592 domain-containing protein n=1 Tax=Micromonospora peucetia TaxID=47871 RepID=A0A1C6VE43_9ACTN|nr:DUF3592 domain-containing protein [Micromonospora peucetia]MCX4389696.1 DUF3592 domain-containing protein [Micromonospora peucetia]WSA30169.1 DUF3592 domain-containing protein [Micromonospora peucetia]SCL64651.1 hypothetical protein GA0070608_2989 [Micromonospora peucetia]
MQPPGDPGPGAAQSPPGAERPERAPGRWRKLRSGLHNIHRGSAALGLVLLLAGLTYAVAIGAYKWHLHAKAERLRADGVPVQATVTDRRDNVGRGGGTDTVQVWYDYEGVQHNERILCGSAGGCVHEPPEVMMLWVDPERPGEFVAANGNTDDSVFFLNAWGGIPFGLLVAALGGVFIFAALVPTGMFDGPAPAPRRKGPGRDRVRRTRAARRRGKARR